jgi:hypothetical protein
MVEPLWFRVWRRFRSNHAFRYMYALALFIGWIAGLSVRAYMPIWLIIAEVIGLGIWMLYELLFAQATRIAWYVAAILMLVGAVSIYALFLFFTINVITILAIIGVLAYGIFGVILNLDALKEAYTILSGKRS